MKKKCMVEVCYGLSIVGCLFVFHGIVVSSVILYFSSLTGYGYCVSCSIVGMWLFLVKDLRKMDILAVLVHCCSGFPYVKL